MLGNWHVPCGAGEKPEITSNAYLLLRLAEEGLLQSNREFLIEYDEYYKITNLGN